MKLPCPDETSEEATLCEYCDARHWVHWHVPQETFTKSWSQKRKNALQGVKPGVSDHWIILPSATGYLLVVIELKRQHGNTPTNEQISFLHAIDAVTNVVPVCCYGAAEAIEVLEGLMFMNYEPLDRCNERMEKLWEKRQKTAQKPKKTPKTAKNTENDLPY